MKRLIVMRHAKSSWDTDAPNDHKRPLNKRGQRAAMAVGAHLKASVWVPERVIASDSARTTETWRLAAPHLGRVGVELSRDLYHAGPAAVKEHLGGLPDDVTTALVLGHNPGWEAVVRWLSKESVELKTADCALLCCHGANTWADALEQAGQWTLERIVRARDVTPAP